MIGRLRYARSPRLPSYLSLASWTDQGLKAVKDSPQRLEGFKQAVAAAGGRVIFVYTLMGGIHDIATLMKVPDEATSMRLSLEIGRLGSVRGINFRAFTAEETRALMESLP